MPKIIASVVITIGRSRVLHCRRQAGGRAILVGIRCEDRTTFTASTARVKDLTIRVVHRMKHTYPRVLALVESGRADVRSLVTHRMPLAEAPRAFALAQQREGIKVVVDC
jgi:L-iditol 2-dehydrogenase